nr:tetratricopeptide repeat protein [Amycolatopsis suaedae]
MDQAWSRRGPSSGLAVLTGMGGVGKTTQALAWIRRHSNDFPDVQLYASLGGSSELPADPNDVLQAFLLSLGSQPEQIPSNLAQRAASFRAATLGQQVAVLLDDAVSAAQVTPLLPAGRDSMAIVTSRRRLTSLGTEAAVYIPVPVLDNAQAWELFTRGVGDERVTAERDAAASIVEACGGLPLALSLAAARLRGRPRRPLSREAMTYRRDAGSTGDRLPDVRTVLDQSYEELSSTAARLYLTCGVHPAPAVSVDALAAAGDTRLSDVDDDIDELIEANLLDDLDDGRVVQHDLLHHDAQVRAATTVAYEERATILRRFLAWYLERATAADQFVHPYRDRLAPVRPGRQARAGLSDRTSAVRWWLSDLSTVLALFTEAVRHRWDEEVWQLGEAAWGFFLHHRGYHRWLPVFEAAAEAAARCGNQVAEARLRSQLGFAFAKLRRFDEAARENNTALWLGRQAEHEPTQATALAQLGRVARGRKDWATALNLYREAALLQERLGIPRGVALCRRRAGEVLIRLGRLDEAEAELAAAAQAMADLGDRAQHARAMVALARLRHRNGHTGDALDLLHNALQAMRELRSPYYTAEVLTALADIEAAHGHDEQARRHLTEAHDLYVQLGDPRVGDLDTSPS